jgi:hypothetical protein
MHYVTDILNWAFPKGLDAWSVIVGALLLAVVQRIAQGGGIRNYDAWWYYNIDPAALKAPLPPPMARPGGPLAPRRGAKGRQAPEPLEVAG